MSTELAKTLRHQDRAATSQRQAGRSVGLPLCPAVRVPVAAATLDGFRAWMRSRRLQFPVEWRFSFLGQEIFLDLITDAVSIPTRAFSLEGFRDWATSREFPEHGRISFLGTEIYLDMSPEELGTHNAAKTTVLSDVYHLNKRRDIGKVFSDRTLVTNEDADLSTEPDGTFVKWTSFKSGRVRLVPAKDRPEGFVQIQGSPDWVLEMVSENSVVKDAQELPEKYYRAGMTEFWLVDARGPELEFQVLVRGRKGFVPAPRRCGWQRSRVFGRFFRLVRKRDRAGLWQYDLESRPA